MTLVDGVSVLKSILQQFYLRHLDDFRMYLSCANRRTSLGILGTLREERYSSSRFPRSKIVKWFPINIQEREGLEMILRVREGSARMTDTLPTPKFLAHSVQECLLFLHWQDKNKSLYWKADFLACDVFEDVARVLGRWLHKFVDDGACSYKTVRSINFNILNTTESV